MKDLYKREISYLRISITDACNLRCLYCVGDEPCSNNSLPADEMSPEEIIHVARAAVSLGIKKIRVTGGEPLIRPDVVQICEGLGKIEGLEELTMTTNGLLLEKYAKQLKKAGVSRVNISLDTMDSNKFCMVTGREELKTVRKGIEAAKEAGLLPIKINVVLLAGINDDEIEKFAALTLMDHIEVRFIELMPIGAANYNDFSFLSGDVVVEKVPELIPVEDSGVAKLYQLPNGKGKVGIIRPVSRHFCPSCNRIRLTSDGKLKPCLHSDEEIKIRHLSGDELIETIKSAIAHKPMEHGDFLEGEQSDSKRGMNRIGG